ncbi:MAG: proteasome accessory factor PafA2 family protein [Candidatus Methanomethyliaceae archaeon]|nr:proteasome accessory factor PafA2 family protein [Candidatus Methanomethyliaceae archaeon]
MWQGVEVEYCIPYIHGKAYVNELLEALRRYKMPPKGDPPFLIKRGCESTQFLINGGRAYGDMSATPGVYDVLEITTPECPDPFTTLTYEKATEIYARIASEEYERESGLRVHCYKISATRSEHEYTTRGLHESYLVDRAGFSEGIKELIPYLVVRQVFTGVGGYYFGKFMISPRQMFVKSVFADKVFGSWPLIGGVDEPHTDPKFRRVQITNGEGARSEWTTFMRQAITSYIIRGIERGLIKNVPKVKDPVEATKLIAISPEGDWEIQTEGDKEVTVFDLLSYYLEGIEKLFSIEEVNDWDKYAIQEFKYALKKLEEGNFQSLKERVEWITKLEIIEKNFEKYFESEDSVEEKKVVANNQFTAVTDATYERIQEELALVALISDEDLSRAVLFPPKGSRGFARVKIAKQLSQWLDDIGWANIVVNGMVHPMLDLNGWDEERIADFIEMIKGAPKITK